MSRLAVEDPWVIEWRVLDVRTCYHST